jgi:hypothetical protein
MLQKSLPEGYHVFPNMRIADIIDPVDGKGFYNRRNSILPKHIDFLICNDRFQPVHAVELNGSSHRNIKRAERDVLVKQIFEEASIPLTFVWVGESFEGTVRDIMATWTNK